MNEADSRKEAPLLSGKQTVLSIRDTGYKSTDYAIAELIDNAVDAKAQNVTVAIVEEQVDTGVRLTKKVTEIAVIDDGDGMTTELANLALSFGGSGDYNNRTNIGRFGMGLPQASVSQCKRTELWTWQESTLENASRTVLDLNKIEAGEQENLTVPWPTSIGDMEHKPLDQWIVKLFEENHKKTMKFGQSVSSGTVVKWNDLDRLRWVKASSVLKHTEFLLGRIYRNFIKTGELNIRIVKLERGDDGNIILESNESIRPNDPLYLSVPSETILEYWESDKGIDESSKSEVKWKQVNDQPPFEVVVNNFHDYEIPIDESGATSKVSIVFSECKAEARPGDKAGESTNLGRQSKENRGISIVRAGRELVLEQTLVTEPTDRWWGVEVSFEPDLDEIFGVTNDKQDAPYFTNALKYAIEYDLTVKEAEAEGLFPEDDLFRHLYDIGYSIRKRINGIKSASKKRKKEKDRNKNPNQSPIAEAVTRANKKRSQLHPTDGERQFSENSMTPEQAADAIETELQRRHKLPDEYAKIVAEQYKKGITVHFLESAQAQSPAFFWTDEIYNDEQIFINSEHPAYSKLIEPLRLSSDEISRLSEDKSKKLLGAASDALGMLIQAYARLELEVGNDPEISNHYRNVREEWGKRLREIMVDPSLDFDEIFESVDE